MRSKFYKKLLERLDLIDPDSLQSHFLRLAGERGMLDTIFHSMQEGLVVLDHQAEIVYANRAAEQMIGFSLVESKGVPLKRYIKDFDWDEAIIFDGEESQSKMVTRDLEITYPERRFVEFYLVPLRESSDFSKGAVVIFRDVTHRRREHETTMESERMSAITLLAAGVAHEIGNPLNSLNIHLQLLERELEDLSEADGDELKEMVGVCKDEVVRLDQIISQFLKALRPQPVTLAPCDVGRLLIESVDFLSKETGDRGVLIELDLSDRCPLIPADAVQIKQVFYNIIRNAVQSMVHGGVLRITLTPDDRFVAIAFKDSGSGIEPDQLSRIFDAYHTTKSEGSGLGLMIVQRIMRGHGGQIEVESEPGKGSTFTLLFPRTDQRIRMLGVPKNKEKIAP